MTFPILGGNGAGEVGYQIDNSLRFNDDDSPVLSRTLGTPTNNKIYTYSFWIKRANLVNGSCTLLSTYQGSVNSPFTYVGIESSGQLYIQGYDDENTLNTNIATTQLFRDVSAYYNLQIAFDTSQSTASDRVKVYVNGNQVSDFSVTTYPSQNKVLGFNDSSSSTKYIGKFQYTGGNHFDGYFAETYFIDGQQLSPTDFGEFDSDSGIWKPIEYTGTYGTNGFYLDFENSGSLGADQSGNGNDFTPTNLASTDQTTDTPTNNFATWNPLVGSDSGGATYYLPTTSEGNLKIQPSNASQNPVGISTIGMTTGKWYAEFRLLSETDTGAGSGAGVTDSIDNFQQENVQTASQIIYNDDGNVINRTSSSASGTTFTTSDIIGIALDIDNGFIYFSKNGTYINSGVPTSGGSGTGGYSLGTAQGEYFFIVQDSRSGNISVFDANFGSPYYSISSGNSDGNGYGNFEYAPPSGYLALCTQNLATELSPTIDDGSEYFHTQLYTGTGSARSVTNDANAGDFQPDLIWVKERSSTSSHQLTNSNVGVEKRLSTDLTDGEYSDSTMVTSFDSDGFSVGSHGGHNESGQTYVAWQWKANGGTTSSNTDGSITSTVQANTTAGFSIVTFTGDGNDNASVGHGLGVTPEIIIIKNRDVAQSWVFNANLSSKIRMNLDTTNADLGDFTYYMGTQTSSNIVFGNNHPAWNGSGNDMVAYVFHSVEGYSKMGLYTGNGSSDGTFVYTGFRPAFILMKRINTTGAWKIFDNKRPNPFNVIDARIEADNSGAESTNSVYSIDLISNGFKLRGTSGEQNGSGDTFIYMCFASNPFVSSTSIPVTAR